MSVFVWLDGPRTVAKNCQKFTRLSKGVAMVNNKASRFQVFKTSLTIVCQILKLALFQKLNNSMVYIDGRFHVSYTIGGRVYTLVTEPIKGPGLVMMVTDNFGNDMTNVVKRYLGPEEDGHGCVFTPGFFDREELFFELSDGREVSFKEEEDIQF